MEVLDEGYSLKNLCGVMKEEDEKVKLQENEVERCFNSL